MHTAWGIALLGGLFPLVRAWRGARGSTLRHPLMWAAVAWGAWCLAAFLDWPRGWRYLALCATACAGVAVLGARRPGAGAWHFVVAGLLAALCRPFLEGMGDLRLESPHLVFLGAALAVALGNYAPTRQAPAALLLGAWCALEVAGLAGVTLPGADAAPLLLALAPWVAWWRAASPGGGQSEINRAWRAFRDRFGFVWAQRVREQFNRAAANAGLTAELGWGGVRSAEGESPERPLALLAATLRRFRTDVVEDDG